MNFEFKESFESIKKTLPKKIDDGYNQKGQTLYNSGLNRIEIFGKEGCFLCINSDGTVEADIAPFCG